METSDQIIIYQTRDGTTSIEVKLENDTIWLTQAQMQELFNQTKQNISLHINNVFKENELTKSATVKNSLTVQKEGTRSIKRKLEFYSLDVIISVGYRVKSQRGTQFRIWANQVLKEYLLKGYSINKKQVQTFDGVDLYPSVEEKNNTLYKVDGSKRIADNALVALTLMIAESKSDEKETHPAGQILLVISGVGYYQEKGQPRYSSPAWCELR
ncbi:RhuM family protein [Pedobacter sp. FW305-3-2-15-E-R2A2]|uniref:RhuM family protein n=1 Tax=Pedobacter sp. FW305-3-2-15-E-R2A2 TaxID=3140251 RepID=UPI0031408326